MSKDNLFADIIRKAKMVDGVCPHCTEHTLLISVVHDYYRCLNCGGDIEQKVNGEIKYMPVKDRNTRMKFKIDYENGEEI